MDVGVFRRRYRNVFVVDYNYPPVVGGVVFVRLLGWLARILSQIHGLHLQQSPERLRKNNHSWMVV